MTENSKFARPYAKAIFDLAKAEKSYTKWAELLKNLAIIVEDKQTLKLLKMPMLSTVEKANFIIDIGGVSKVFDESAKALIKLLAEYGRLSIVSEIYALYEKYCSEEEHTLEAKVYTAILLDDKQKEKLHLAISSYFKKSVILVWQEDPSLIGGIIVKAEDKIFDGSIRGQLQSLHATLVSH